MIRDIKGSSVKVIELGNGNTFLSQVVKKGETKSRGIAFSNDKEDVLGSNSVIIEILNNKGAMGYIKAIIGLLESHQENEDNIKELREIETKLINLIDIKNTP